MGSCAKFLPQAISLRSGPSMNYVGDLELNTCDQTPEEIYWRIAFVSKYKIQILENNPSV